MNKTILILFIALAAFGAVKAQSSDTLTNNSIVKMVRAQLTDDLIIDEIKSSTVNFNVNPDSIQSLASRHVSYAVIDAMKIAEKSSSVVPVKVTSVTPTKPVQVMPTPTVTPSSGSTLQNSDKKYYIILASYKTSQEAFSAVSKLQATGMAFAEVIGKKDTIANWRVSYKSYSTNDEALMDLPKVQKSYPSAWILSMVSEHKEAILSHSSMDAAKPVIVKKDSVIMPVQNTSPLGGSSPSQIKDTQKVISVKPPEIKTVTPPEEPQRSTAKTKNDSVHTPNPSSVAARYIEAPRIISTISYVAPLNNLITFDNVQYTALTVFMKSWDKRIRDSLQKEKLLMEKIVVDEKALNDKKNENVKGFTAQILVMQNKLSKERDDLKALKRNIVINGRNLTDLLKNLASNTDGLINNKFNEVSKMVAKSHPNPTLGDTGKVVTITKQKYDDTLLNHINPLTVILAYYKNENSIIKDTILFWNKIALAPIHNDLKLVKQLAPLETKLQQYLSAPKDIQKINKKDIETLKKRCKGLNKDREQVAKQMVGDSKRLAACLDNIRQQVRLAMKERFLDAIEDINRSYE